MCYVFLSYCRSQAQTYSEGVRHIWMGRGFASIASVGVYPLDETESERLVRSIM